MTSQGVTIQMETTIAITEHFPPVLLTTQYKESLTFAFLSEILKCDHSNESYQAVLCCGAFCQQYF